MQVHVVELIRELMKTQRMSIRKISAQIAKDHGGSEFGYTQQINRILNDPDYDPTFSTVQKILSALKGSVWQTLPPCNSRLQAVETRLDELNSDMTQLKTSLDELQQAIALLTRLAQAKEHLDV